MSERVFRELAALTRVVASSRRLERALSSADVPEDSKRALLDDLTNHAFDAATLDAAVSAIAKTAASTAEALAVATTDAAFDTGDLQVTEAALVSIASLIEDNSELRQALSDFAVDDEPKAKLLSDLLAGKADPIAIELACSFVYLDNGRATAKRALDAARRAADHRGALIADVRTAIELDDQRKASLASALQSAFGRSVQPRFSIDSSIIGSVVVRVGDVVLDGSARHRLEQARRAVA